MHNKWFLYSVIVFILSSCNFIGQREEGRMSSEMMAERQTQMMIEMLDLTEQQVLNVARINTQYGKEMTTLRKSARWNREEIRSGMNELRIRKDEVMQTVLTDDQYKKYKESQRNRKHKRIKSDHRRN